MAILLNYIKVFKGVYFCVIMKFLIVGDLHGQKPKIHFKDFDAIIAPGDFCSDAPRKYMFAAMKKRKETGKEIWWWDVAGGKRKAMQMVKTSLADGRKITEYLNSFGVPVYAIPGNWDWSPEDPRDLDCMLLTRNYYPDLFEGLRNIVDVHLRGYTVEGLRIIGHGITSGPEIPQSSKEQKVAPVSAASLRRWYTQRFSRLKRLFAQSSQPILFLSHNVPYNTSLDQITDPHNPRHGLHFGSLIARKLIEEFQPPVCVGAHMHEHFGTCTLGKTVCINAGFGGNVNTLLELSNSGKILQLRFYPSSGEPSH